MSLDRTLKKLETFEDVMRFNNPAAEETIDDFQKESGIKLPRSYIEMIRRFDGGELFIPGTLIYGVAQKTGGRTVRDVNDKPAREELSIPDKLLIFGRENYGDWMCMDLNGTNEIVQWDSETDEEMRRWPDMYAWLRETICSYEQLSDAMEQ